MVQNNGPLRTASLTSMASRSSVGSAATYGSCLSLVPDQVAAVIAQPVVLVPVTQPAVVGNVAVAQPAVLAPVGQPVAAAQPDLVAAAVDHVDQHGPDLNGNGNGNDVFNISRRGRGRPSNSLNRPIENRVADWTRNYGGDLPCKSPRKLEREAGFYIE